MATYYFYKNLKSISDFTELSNSDIYTKVPNDWHLFATDVKDSTKNIEKGKYKEINMLGAMSIISVLNVDRTLELPYIFGGDGAFILVPRRAYKGARRALVAVREMAKEAYGLELRIGSISLEKLSSFEKEIFIAKYKPTQNHEQALIKGEGLDYFDYLLKLDDKFHIKDKKDEFYELDLEGLECRWSYIESSKDETLSFILKCPDEKDYKEVLENIEKIIGDSNSRHPIDENKLLLSFKAKDLNVEASFLSKSSLGKMLNLFKLRVINFLGLFLMKFKIGEWENYKKRIISTTDIEKFDNIVRMVFSISNKQMEKLEEYLEKEYQNKKLVYGINKSKHALMTCLIFERHGKHIHFVDTTNGGYAIAAKAYKKRLEEISGKIN